jgi:hypothetical protein
MSEEKPAEEGKLFKWLKNCPYPWNWQVHKSYDSDYFTIGFFNERGENDEALRDDTSVDPSGAYYILAKEGDTFLVDRFSAETEDEGSCWTDGRIFGTEHEARVLMELVKLSSKAFNENWVEEKNDE